LRANYEVKNWYADLRSVLYLTKDYDPTGHLIIFDESIKTNETIFYQKVEVGYRFNKKMNLKTFLSWRYRSTTDQSAQTANIVQFGFRTALTNQYNDF
ncbi:MAG: hypothetical protein ACI865_003065, partial [Flavobacteriaceae bacterium]